MDENHTAEPCSTGLDPTLAAALAYLIFFVSGIFFLVVEKKNNYVRFHAMQSTITFLILAVLSVATSWIPLIGSIVSWLIPPLSLVLWILLMVKAFQGERFKLPIVGDMAEDRTGR